MNATALNLWPGVAPGSEGWTQEESEYLEDDYKIVRNVVVPTITPFLPSADAATGAGIVIAPGGGLRIVAIEHEGTRVAEWFTARGVAAFVVKYRVIDTGPTREDMATLMASFLTGPSDVPLLERMLDGIGPLAVADAHRAMEIVRENHAEWLVEPSRLGFLGFSAGGYLTVEMALADAALRPAFVAPIYPGLHGHRDVPHDAPPLFTAVAEDDPICFGCTKDLAADWQAAGRPAEIHIYPSGSHGFGLHNDGRASDKWIEDCYAWMVEQSIV